MFDAKLDEKQVKERSGQKSKAVFGYRKLHDPHFREVSNILYGNDGVGSKDSPNDVPEGQEPTPESLETENNHGAQDGNSSKRKEPEIETNEQSVPVAKASKQEFEASSVGVAL